MSECYISTVWIFGYICSAIITIISLIYGILMVIPAGPFDSTHIATGITLIVLSIFGVISGVGLLIGCLIGGIICLPLLFFCK